MKLYKMECYKLCHKKSFLAGLIIVLLLELFFFYESSVRIQNCDINGSEYTGFDAVRRNRQITEEFRGVLTDDTVEQIIAKYGFPRETPDGYTPFLGNFLNTFVANYASDGRYNGSGDYLPATGTVPLSDTDMARYHAACGLEIRMEYYDGWTAFHDTYGLLMLWVCMLILYAVSTVFSDEEQTGMKALLFTSKEGPSADVLAKIAAAFSVSVGIWMLAVLVHFLLHAAVFGTDGLKCAAGVLEPWGFHFGTPLLEQTIGAYLTQKLLISLLAILELCAVTVCVSASCRSSFHAIVGAGICYVLPFLGFVLIQTGSALIILCNAPDSVLTLGGCYALLFIRCLTYGSPVYLLVSSETLYELSRTVGVRSMTEHFPQFSVTLALLAFLTLYCTAAACRRYRLQGYSSNS